MVYEEIDEFGIGNKQGSVIENFRGRTDGRKRPKEIMISTPVLEAESQIWIYFDMSDQRHYLVPCLGCGVMQELLIKNLKQVEGTAYYLCPECGHAHQERDKMAMLREGSWKAMAKGQTGVVGFRINGLYSPTYSWARLLNFKERAEKSADLKTSFRLLKLVERVRHAEDAPDEHRLKDVAADYALEKVPAEAVLLTAGVDVQGGRDARLEVNVYGWGRRMRSFLIATAVFPLGEEERLKDVEASPWKNLTAYLASEFPHELGGVIGINCAFVDSGFETHTVYLFCRTNAKAHAVDGRSSKQSGGSRLLNNPVRRDVELPDGRVIQRGARLFPVGVDVAKEDIYSNLRAKLDLKPGFFGEPHWPRGLDSEWFRQLVAEHRVLNPRTKKLIWDKRPGYDRNEALDMAVYALAAAHHERVHILSEASWKALENAAKPKDLPKKVDNANKPKLKKWIDHGKGKWL